MMRMVESSSGVEEADIVLEKVAVGHVGSYGGGREIFEPRFVRQLYLV